MCAPAPPCRPPSSFQGSAGAAPASPLPPRSLLTRLRAVPTRLRALPTRLGPFPLLAAAAALCLLAVGCSHAPRRSVEDPLVRTVAHDAGGVRFLLAYVEADAAVLDDVRAALDAAVPRVGTWGGFRHPVTVRIQPDHAALETAAGRPGYPWLRAWARFDEILLQSPASFGLFEGGDRNLRELLTHELTHCLMYQLAAQAESWRRTDAQIPLWFREGMASWTAGQGHRRMDPDAVAEWTARTGRDPLQEAEILYREHMGPVYGAAHHAFARLVAAHGEGAVRGILGALQAGVPFDAAFRAYTGVRRRVFEVAFTHRLAGEAGLLTRQTPAAPPPTEEVAPEAARRPSAGAGAPPR